MPTDRQGQRLPVWLDAARQDDVPSLHTIAVGIDRDINAVIVGIALRWNSGIVEARVNRSKMLKGWHHAGSISVQRVYSRDEACNLAPQEQLHPLLIQIDLGGPATK
ncbi:hypothetical protein [Streptomyces sp. NPDC126514]|uniref:hypothetical protein n=1 Tax=Streptomyces sp. NPDC126514 TaxID=3155210 RepID=UPI00332D1782